MTEYLENPRCGDSSSSFSLEFSSDMNDMNEMRENEMEGGGFKAIASRVTGLLRRSPSPKSSSNLDFVAISDPEGYDILAQARGNNFDLTDKTSKQQLYICGDLIDSTASFGDNIGIIEEEREKRDEELTKDEKEEKNKDKDKDKKFNISELIVTELDRVRAKSYNLHNIALCMVHERIHLIFGNRDLNKLKCKFLCKLAGKGEFIDKFNNGNIDLKIDSTDRNHLFESNYTKLKNEITQKQLNKKPWEIHRMSQWYPFWNLEKLIDEQKLGKWKSMNDYSNNFFLDRFNEIFGADPTVGTISAQNLLYTIPYEIDNNNLREGLVLNENDNDFRAFIVLAVFRSMCLKAPKRKFEDIFTKSGENSILTKKPTTSHYKGWLYNLYNKGSVVKVIDDKKENVYVMSHGGITKTLMENKNNMGNMRKALSLQTDKEYKVSLQAIIEAITNSDKLQIPKKGGFYIDDIDNKNIKVRDLLEIEKLLNDTFKSAIKNVLNTSTINFANALKAPHLPTSKNPEGDILFLLMTTAPYNCEKINEKLEKKIPCKILNEILFDPNSYGPIFPGMLNIRKNMFTCSDRKMYQIIGHVPVGFGTCVDMYRNKENNYISYLINLDNSGTFTGTHTNKITEKKNSASNSMFIVTDNIPKILNNITFNDTAEFKIYDNNNKDKWSFIENKNYIIKSKDIYISKELKINNNIKDINNFIEKTHRYTDTDRQISYHGYYQVEQNKVHALTINKGQFDKNFLLLTDTDFNTFVENKAAKESHAGGYQKKYLKYKQKYLQLKKMLEQQQ